jgi:hypothetical protein
LRIHDFAFQQENTFSAPPQSPPAI